MKNYSVRFMLLRRFVQVGLIVLYLLAHYAGWKILDGNLSSSLVFGVIPLADPLGVLQLFLAGAALGVESIVGALIVIVLYGLVLGRGYCAYVCPVNLITDSANFLRRKLAFKESHWGMSKKWRYYLLSMIVLFTPFVGLPLFELINPVALVHRGIVFGMGLGWAVVVAIWLFDFLMIKNGFCAHLCPIGAFYSIIGRFSLIRVRHDKDKCTLCMACKEVCPEKQVLHIVGKESTIVSGGECCNCGRCVEVCGDDALHFSIRDFIKKEKKT